MPSFIYAEKLLTFFANTPLVIWIACNTVVLILYYAFLFHKFRLSPNLTVLSSGELPNEISPGSARYLWKGHYDSDCLLAAIVSAIVKGQYSAKWFPDGFKITYLPHPPQLSLAQDERQALTFSNGQFRDIISIGKYKSRFTEKAEDRMLAQLKSDHKDKFLHKWKYVLAGIIFGVLSTLLAIYLFQYPYTLLSAVYGIILIPMAIALSYLAYKAWEEKNWRGLSLSLFFLAFCLLSIWKFETSLPQYFYPFFLSVYAVSYAAFKKLPHYSREGWERKRKIDAFRDFLLERIASGRRLDETEAQYLPYLIALEIPFGREAYFAPLLASYQK